MDKITYFDVEYANSKNKSICQIGIMCENYGNGDPVYPELDIYINPEDGFDSNCIRVHGIMASRVATEPNFPTVWKDIEKYFTHTVVVGHNVAAADLDSLVKALNRYNLDIPEIYYICTLDLARQYVPRFAVKDYSISSLCEYFDIDIDSEHNAFDDACACSDLFRALVETYDIDVDSCVKKYIPKESADFSEYVASPVLRKSISEFYGTIFGFSIDSVITEDEVAYMTQWRENNKQYASQRDIAAIIEAIDAILEDGIVTQDELETLQYAVGSYLDLVSTSQVTLATQILDGILKGITADGEVTEAECKNLRQWLYDNIYLSDHFPFNKTIELVERVLEDSVITKEESAYITAVIDDMLNPVQALSAQVNSVEGKHVCLSGNFAYGPKSAVEKYIVAHGGIMDSGVKKSTNILLVGNEGSQDYSNGNYGTKVKKAIEYNEKGCKIQIIKEADFVFEK